MISDVLAEIEINGNSEKTLAKLGWRIEVTGNGKYWQWRKGSKNNRVSAYGGRFYALDGNRQEEYWQNRKSYARNGVRDSARLR